MVLKVKCFFPVGDLQLATANLQDQYGNWDNKIISLSPLSRCIGDDKAYEVSGISIELIDSDRFFRNMMSGTFRYIVGKQVELYTEDHQWIYTGTVDKWKFKEDVFELVINDKLSGLDSQVPRIITTDLFTGLTEGANGQSVPVIYGQVESSAGSVKCWKVAENQYLLAGHYCDELTNVFKDDGTDISGDFQLSNVGDPAQGNDFAYVEYIGTASFDEPFVMANVKGKRMTGGELIENPIDALTDLLDSYTGMTYDATKMEEVKVIMNERQYKISMVIVNRETLEQILMDFCTSFDCDYFIKKGNQVVISLLDWTFLQPGGFFTQDHVVDFQIDELSEEIRNKVYYKYCYHPADQKYLQTRVYSKQASIDNWGEFFFPNEPLEMICVSDMVTAIDIVQRYLIQRKNPRRIAQLEIPLQEFSGLGIADVIEIQHPNAIDENKRKYQIRRLYIDFIGDGVQVEAVDITYMTGGMFILGNNGNESLPNPLPRFWGNAAGTQRDYGYLADKTGGFFGNDIDYGKGLY